MLVDLLQQGKLQSHEPLPKLIFTFLLTLTRDTCPEVFSVGSRCHFELELLIPFAPLLSKKEL